MASETTTTSLNDLTQAFIAEARFVEGNGVDLSNFVTRRQQPMGHKGVLFPEYGAASHSSVAEGTDATNQEVTTSGTTVTPGEYVTMVTLTDIANNASQAQVGADLGRLAREAKRDAVNQAVYALFDGFSTTIGTTNVDVTEALIQQAVRQLRINKAPGPYYLGLTPHVLEDLLGLYTSSSRTNINEVTSQAITTGTLPPIHGVIPVVIDNLAAGTGTGQIDEADTKTAVWSAAAIGMAMGYDWKVETQRDASMRGNEFVATSYWAVAEVHDGWGIELLVDNKD